MNTPRHLAPKALVIALALGVVSCSKTPEQSFRQAQEWVNKSDYKAAIIELKSVLQAQPDNREARLLLGEVFIKKEAYPEAEKELSRARSLGVPDERVLPALARVYVKMGEPEKALGLSIPETGLSPRSLADLHAARAEALLSQGKKEAAQQAVKAAKQADPNQPSLLLTQARLALVDRQKDQAVQFVDQAIRKAPDFADALFLKAAFHESENRPGEAAKLYQQILANDPSQFRAHLALAALHLKKRDVEAADKAIQAAEKIAGTAALVMYARATLELQRGNADKASATLQQILRVAPDHLPSMLAYALASYNLGNYEQSINYAGKVLRVAPNNLTATKVLAGSQLKAGDAKGALRTLGPTLAKYPADPGLLALAGDAHLLAGNYDQAMSHLDKAADLEPENAVIKTRLAAGHLAAGDADEALADLEAATSLSRQAGNADLALIMLHLKGKEYDKALQAIAGLEKKLPNNPVTHNLRAAVLLGKKDYAGARKALEKALAIDPKFAPAAMNLARLDIHDKKPEAARKRLESLLAHDKDNVKAMLALANLAASEKKDKEYVSWLERAARAAPPGNLEPHARLVQHYLARKEHQKALGWAREASKANPDSLQAISLLGTTQLQTGDRSAAIDTFSRLTLRAPRSPEAHLRLASALIADKKNAQARESLRNAIKLKPDFFQAQSALIRIELADHNPEAALKIARQIEAQQPQSPLGYDLEADILFSQKRFPSAIKAYELALEKGATSAGLIKLHRALNQSGDTKSAEQRLQGWLKQHPRDLAVRAYAAEFYMMMSHRERDAIAQYEQLLQLEPQNAVSLNNLANLYQRANDHRALSVAEQAHKLAPNHPGVKDTLGWILLQQGQLPRAVDLLGKAARRAPKAGNIRYHYGVALARSGRKVEARKELEAAIASGQTFAELEDAKVLLKSL